MPVSFIEDRKLFKLDAAGTTYVMAVVPGNYLLGLYWGAPVPDANFDGYAFRDYASSFSPSCEEVGEGPFSPDTAPLEYAGFGTGDFRKCYGRIRVQHNGVMIGLIPSVRRHHAVFEFCLHLKRPFVDAPVQIPVFPVHLGDIDTDRSKCTPHRME